jgi:hypothetical protein
MHESRVVVRWSIDVDPLTRALDAFTIRAVGQEDFLDDVVVPEIPRVPKQIPKSS